jgi:hypothetical protein
VTGFSHTAVELFDAGFGPFMVRVKPFSKAPIGSSVTAKCASREEALRWDAAGLSVGLRGGDAFLWIDNDFGKLFTRLVEHMIHDLGVVSLRRFVDSPRHRRDAFLFRIAPPTKTLSLKFLDPVLGVEGEFGLRGSGQQALITGIHPPTGARYLTCRKLTRIEDVPEVSASAFSNAFQWTVEQALKAGLQVTAGMPGSGSLVYAVPRALGLPHQKQKTRDTQTGSNPRLAHDLLDPAEVRQLLGFVPNDPTKWSKALGDFLSVRNNWRDICYAIIGATGGSSEGRTIWIEWSDQHPQFKRSSSDQWDACMHSAQTDGVRVGGTFLIELAQRYAWDDYHKAAAQTFADHPIDMPDDPRPLWDAFRAQWAVWSNANRYVEFASSKLYDTRGFNMHCNAQLLGLWVERYGSNPKKRPPKNMSDYVDAQADTLKVQASNYCPGRERLFLQEKDDAMRTFNEWTAPKFDRFSVLSALVQPWLNHVGYVLNDPAEAQLFVRFLAFLQQYPGTKPNWAWLILSVPGIGKDTMMKPTHVALGPDNVKQFTLADIDREFSYFLKTKLLIGSEIAHHDDPREAKALFDRFKLYAAAPPDTLQIRELYRPPYSIPNLLGMVLFSNHLNAMAIDLGDRRVHVVSALKVQRRPDDYYAKLHDWLDDKGSVLVANYLADLPLSQAHIAEFLGAAPMTDAKQVITRMNANQIQSELWEIIEEARDGRGRFAPLVATVNALTLALSLAVRGEVRHKQTSDALMELCARGRGVFPARPSPSEPSRPGKVISKNGESERFWLLADVHPQTGVKLRNLKGQELFDALNQGAQNVAQTSQFPPNVVPIRPKKPASKKGFSTTVPDDPV